jgi:hypothetical protein
VPLAQAAQYSLPQGQAQRQQRHLLAQAIWLLYLV